VCGKLMRVYKPSSLRVVQTDVTKVPDCIIQGNTLSYSPHVMSVKPKSSGFGGKTKFSQIVMTLDWCQKRRRIDETQPNEALRTRFPLMCAHLLWLGITT